MVRQSYNLGGMFFSSKQAVLEYAKAIKDNASPGKILEGQDLDFMYDLLRWHPNAAEKIGAGVQTVFVRANPLFGHNEFYLRRTDGTGTEFSYKQCVQPSTPDADFRTACRVAVEPDIIAYRQYMFEQTPVIYCPFTGERMTRSMGHVDHIPPNTFSTLVKQFIAEQRLIPGKVQIAGRGEDNSFRIRIADKSLEQQWVEYHRRHAYLRIISNEANQRMVGQDWDIILNYLHSTNYQNALVEWKGRRWFYAQHDDLKHGVFLESSRAPEGTPILDGSVLLIEASLNQQGA